MVYEPITDRADLLAYIKRQLGEPSHDIELKDSQYEDCIDDAVQIFLEKGYDGSHQVFEEIELQQDQSLYNLSRDVLAVFNIISTTYSSGNQVAVQAFYQSTFTYQMGLWGGSNYILDYSLARSYIQQISDLSQTPYTFDFNSATKELRVFSVPETKKVLLHSVRYAGEDQTGFNGIYNHRFIKDYSVARSMYQWGKNLMKYRGSIFDGGLELNVDAIVNEGKELLEKAEQMMKDEYQDSYGLIYR